MSPKGSVQEARPQGPASRSPSNAGGSAVLRQSYRRGGCATRTVGSSMDGRSPPAVRGLEQPDTARIEARTMRVGKCIVGAYRGADERANHEKSPDASRSSRGAPVRENRRPDLPRLERRACFAVRPAVPAGTPSRVGNNGSGLARRSVAASGRIPICSTRRTRTTPRRRDRRSSARRRRSSECTRTPVARRRCVDGA